MNSIVSIRHLSYTYPARKHQEMRVALCDISFDVDAGTIFCLLGPNGSGKSTLFNLLSTLAPMQEGAVVLSGFDLGSNAGDIRRRIGVVFQHASLDVKLTVRENLMHQGHLYGLRGTELAGRIEESLNILGIMDRSGDLVETLSGGMQRKVELAKCFLHRPSVLLLDEPSTGLDPAARMEFGRHLRHLCDTFGTTVLLTTHLLDEAEECDTIAIFNQGSLVACDTPENLKREIGGDVISIRTRDTATLARDIRNCFHVEPQVLDDTIHIEWEHGADFIPKLVQEFPGKIETVILSKPSLDDVFIHKTGKRLWVEDESIGASTTR